MVFHYKWKYLSNLRQSATIFVPSQPTSKRYQKILKQSSVYFLLWPSKIMLTSYFLVYLIMPFWVQRLHSTEYEILDWIWMLSVKNFGINDCNIFQHTVHAFMQKNVLAKTKKHKTEMSHIRHVLCHWFNKNVSWAIVIFHSTTLWCSNFVLLQTVWHTIPAEQFLLFFYHHVHSIRVDG